MALEIFEANRDQLTEPGKVKPGQVLRLPQSRCDPERIMETGQVVPRHSGPTGVAGDNRRAWVATRDVRSHVGCERLDQRGWTAFGTGWSSTAASGANKRARLPDNDGSRSDTNGG